MPNLRGKTWTTTTPANVGDAQYWEDHLISDEAATKAASSVQSVNNTLPDENGNINIAPSPLGPTVVDSLNSTSATDALSANQGHVLKGLVDAKQNTLTFDNVPTNGSNNPVKSDGIYDAIEQIYADNGVLGAKNLLVYPYYFTTRTINGVTFTVNVDGSITVGSSEESQTASAKIEFYFASHTAPYTDMSRYSGKSLTLNGGTSDVTLNFWNATSGNFRDSGSGVTFSVPSLSGISWNICAVIQKNVVIATPVTIYPMLRLASDPDDTYVPYAMTNLELTENSLLLPYNRRISSIDLDNVVSSGNYILAGSITHGVGNYGFLFVFTTSSVNAQVRQIFIPLIANDIYTRYKNEGTWSSWVKFTGTVVS